MSIECVEVDLPPTVGYCAGWAAPPERGRLEPEGHRNRLPSGQGSGAMNAAAVDGSAGDDKVMALSHRDDDSGWCGRRREEQRIAGVRVCS